MSNKHLMIAMDAYLAKRKTKWVSGQDAKSDEPPHRAVFKQAGLRHAGEGDFVPNGPEGTSISAQQRDIIHRGLIKAGYKKTDQKLYAHPEGHAAYVGAFRAGEG
jgi:hypothetical protein